MKSKNIVLALGILTFLILNSNGGCKQEEPINEQPLKTAEELGWQTKNLDVATFRNGDPIPEAKTEAEWREAYSNGTPAWCYYLNDPSNGIKYGKLYNWFAINDTRGLAPQGYHIASKVEWENLINYLGGKKIAGKNLKSTLGWEQNGNGTDEIAFSGAPAGIRRAEGNFYGAFSDAHFWSSTNEDGYLYLDGFAWSVSMYKTSSKTLSGRSIKGIGMSVRCVRD